MTTNPNLERDVRNQILFEKYHQGDMKALDELCQSVYKMVCGMVQSAIKGNEYHPLFEDYFAAAQYAVVMAAQKYDTTRGVAWPTYARWKIRSAISHENRHQGIVRDNNLDLWSIDDINNNYTSDEGDKDRYLLPDPSKFEEDFEVRWSKDDFMKSANLTGDQTTVLYGMLEGDSSQQIADDMGRHKNYVDGIKKVIREKFTTYLQEAKTIYKQAKELTLE